MPRPELPLVLHVSRWGELVATGFFAACAFESAKSGADGLPGWLALLGSAGLALVGVAAIVVRPRLEVTDAAITDVGLLSRRTFELRRCGQFRARIYWGRFARSVIEFDYPVGRHDRGRAKSWVQSHGRDATDLAELLNEVRRHAHG